jgi:HAE1 family hydrophobic/amphiphilic exporter-1
MLGGIVFSAVLTFFVVPAAFYLFERKRVMRAEAASAGAGAGASVNGAVMDEVEAAAADR